MTITFEVDDIDFLAINQAVAVIHGRAVDHAWARTSKPGSAPLTPPSDSDVMGRILAQICRSWMRLVELEGSLPN